AGRTDQGRARYAFEELTARIDAYLRTLPQAERAALRDGLGALPPETTDNDALLDHLAEALPAAVVDPLRPLAAT
ncbi:MAG: hypothetical protein KDE24_24945, partial [Caldilinea sp.]|nr:hypothetical protein [Caldilinea sp.]